MPKQADNSVERFELNVSSDPANLAEVRRRVEAFSRERGFDEKATADVGLCVNEAMANVIRHAYQGRTDRPIVVGVEYRELPEASELTVRIRDWGTGVNPEKLPPKPVDPLRPGGLGLVCLRSLMDRATFEPQPDGMVLELVKRKAGAAAK